MSGAPTPSTEAVTLAADIRDTLTPEITAQIAALDLTKPGCSDQAAAWQQHVAAIAAFADLIDPQA